MDMDCEVPQCRRRQHMEEHAGRDERVCSFERQHRAGERRQKRWQEPKAVEGRTAGKRKHEAHPEVSIPFTSAFKRERNNQSQEDPDRQID
jgi:hypothetical protein